MEELEDNISLHNLENWEIPKVKPGKSPDVTRMKKIWVASEKSWFYFKPTCTEEYIQERLAKYEFRRK